MTWLEKIALLIYILAAQKIFSEGGDRLEVFVVLILAGVLFLQAGRRARD